MSGPNQSYSTKYGWEVLHQFDLLSDDVEITETLYMDYIIKGLAHYFPPVDSLSK